MRYLGDLITTARYHTQTVTGNTSIGVRDDQFIQYFNDAQDRIQSSLATAGVYLFETTYEANLVATTRSYALPDRTLAGNRVRMVEYSHNGDSKEYYPLAQLTPLQLSNNEVTYPMGYIVRNGSILISPVPQSGTGKLRITYAQRLDDLDIRRASILSHTDSGSAITALTLDTSDDDSTALGGSTYLCVSDRDGTVTMRNIRYDSYNSSSGVITLTGGSFTYDTGETMANGDYVTIGKDTSTHSSLDPMIERYLIKYVTREIVAIENSSADVAQLDQMLVAMEQDITQLFTPVNQDVQSPPIINEFFEY